MSRTGGSSRAGIALVRVALLSSALGPVGCGSRSALDARLDQPDSELAASAPPDAAPLPNEALGAADLSSETQTGCVDITHRYTSTPPTLMLLIDRSGSMRERFGTSTRWDVLRTAIINPEDGLLTWLDANANVGLMLYTSLNGYEGGRECPIVERVDVQFGNAARIREFYAGAEPFTGGDTPTGDALDAAVAELGALSSGPSRYVLLLTDGVPDTCSEPDPQNGIDAAVDAVVRARAQGVAVRTVGVSPDIARVGLQRMAKAGAGKPIELVHGTDADAERPLYASTEPRELADQLKGAIGDVRSCTVELGTDVQRAHALEGRLSLDGRALAYGDADGWSFEDADTIRVHGQACRRILGQGEQLEVRFPCDAEPRPGELPR
jgi:von Willebrand factor type A domain